MARSADWHRDGINGADIAGVVGLSTWASPYSVWAAKVGRLRRSPAPTAQPSTVLLAAAAGVIEQTTRLHVTLDAGRVSRPGMDWCRAELDGHIHPRRRQAATDGGLTIRAVNQLRWPDGPAPAERCEAQWNMTAAGLDHWWYAIVFRDLHLETFRVEHDRGLEASLLGEACHFWQYVTDRIAPPIDDSEATRQALKTVHAHPATGCIVELDQADAQLVEQRRQAKATIKTATEHLGFVENRLRHAIGDATTVTIDGTPVLSYELHARRWLRPTDIARHEPALAARLSRTSIYRAFRSLD